MISRWRCPYSNSNLCSFIIITRTLYLLLLILSLFVLNYDNAPRMTRVQSPVAEENQKIRPKSGRKPLQLKNSPANTTPDNHDSKQKSKTDWIEISVDGDWNKENHPIYATPTRLVVEPFEVDASGAASLGEELNAIKKKLERMRIDRERTETMLKEREKVMSLQMEGIEQRGDIQKRLEMEVDRLYRLKQLQSYSTRISPIRSLREKEQEKRTCEMHEQQLETRGESLEESVVGETESAFGSPGFCLSSSSGSNSDAILPQPSAAAN